MRAENVNWIADRFGNTDDDVTPNSGMTLEGTLETLAACGRCYTQATTWDVRGGNVPCPNGHASTAWLQGETQ